MITIAMGSDHAGVALKETIKRDLQGHKDYRVTDCGCFAADAVDYPDFAHKVAKAIAQRQADVGILFCGSANGMAIAANKHKQVRAAVCWTETLAALARQHNDANVLCVPARFVEESYGKRIVDTFLRASFEGGRHARRVKKINP